MKIPSFTHFASFLNILIYVSSRIIYLISGLRSVWLFSQFLLHVLKSNFTVQLGKVDVIVVNVP